MVRALAKFVATMVTDENRAIEFGKHWISAAASTPYSEHVLNTLALRYRDDFREEVRSAIQEYNLVQGEAQSLLIKDTQKLLSLTAHRLSLNVELCGELLKYFWVSVLRAKRRFGGVRLSNVFLANADLSFTNLQKIDLDDAQLQGTVLQYADLQKAHFHHTNLQGADLTHAILRNAFMVGTILEGAVLEESELQQAQLTGAQLGALVLRDPDAQKRKRKRILKTPTLKALIWNGQRCHKCSPLARFSKAPS
jgi:hypothetical protein